LFLQRRRGTPLAGVAETLLAMGDGGGRVAAPLQKQKNGLFVDDLERTKRTAKTLKSLYSANPLSTMVTS
jgi:hypothetical protein